MQITREMLQAEREKLVAERDKLLSEVNSRIGSIRTVDAMLGLLDMTEPSAGKKAN